MGRQVGSFEYELGRLAKERARDIDAELNGDCTASTLSKRHRRQTRYEDSVGCGADFHRPSPHHAPSEDHNFLDWPGGATDEEICDLRAEGYRVLIDSTGIHVGWYGSWCGEVSAAP